MVFSPEDNYQANVPTPDDDRFDTSGLELEPLAGDEPKSPLDGYTAEMQEADAAVYDITSRAEGEQAPNEAVGESEERSLEELNQAWAEIKDRQKVLEGEVQVAAVNGNVESFRQASLALTQARIEEAQIQIQRLTADYHGGNFQNRGPSESPAVTDIYNYQVKTLTDQIGWLEKYRLQPLQEPQLDSATLRALANENGVTFFESGSGNLEQALWDTINEADRFAHWEEQNGPGSYGNYTKKLEGALRAALQSATNNSNVTVALKSAANKFGSKLPPDLIQQINTLN